MREGEIPVFYGEITNEGGNCLPSFVIYSFHGLVENMVLLTLAPLCPVS